MSRYIVNFFVSLLFVPFLNAQISNGFDQIPVQNFTRNDYKAGNQNWSIAQDKNGIVYFGNNNGLLSFNGHSWKINILPNHTTIRSVATSENGKIFVGSFEEFGYFEADKFGDIHYNSLSAQLKNYDFHNEEIWNIIIHGNAVYFQSFMVIFKYSNQKIETLIPEGFISHFSKVNNQLIAVINGKGLYTIQDNQFKLLSNDQFFRQKEISTILPLAQNDLLIATLREGVFKFNKNIGVEYWKTDVQQDLKHDQVNKGLTTMEGNILLGTILNGIYILTKEGTLLQHINKRNGLQNNTVLNMFSDMNGDVWVGLDRGIDLLILNSDISFFHDFSGKIGSVYAIHLKEDQLYIGTNQGLYHSSIPKDTKAPVLPEFELISNSQGQVWSIFNTETQFICGHNRGTFELAKKNLVSLSGISGGMSFTIFKHKDSEYLLGSTYTFLVLYEKKAGKWRFKNTIDGFMHPVKQIKVDYLGNIWASHFVKGLYRINLNDSLTRVENLLFYGKNKGFNSDYQINVARLQNRIVFINQGKLYNYNDLLDSITPYTGLEDQLKMKLRIKYIAQVDTKFAWIITEQGILNIYNENNQWKLIKIYPSDLFYEKVISGQEFILPLESGDAILALDNGLAYIKSSTMHMIDTTRKKPILTRILSTGKAETQLPLKQFNNKDFPVLATANNNLTFQFAFPEYRSSSYFLVQLKGLDNNWLKTEIPEFKYDRIPPGKYTLMLRAVDSNGEVSESINWSFYVDPAWYVTKFAQFIYVAIIIGLLFYVRYYYRKRLKNQARRLKIEKERELIRLKNEVLEAEVMHKSKELANTTLSIIKKNELLLEIRKMLMQHKRQSITGQPPKLNGLVNLLDRNISNEADWQVFESNFEQAHEEFLKRIREKIPDLTPSDLKLCAYLRMNLSSKKIALLLGITIRGVENHRYRLRKKIGLEHDSNLIEYLMNF